MDTQFWYKENDESLILNILQSAKDTRSLSDELRLNVSGWSTEYQLSPYRQALFLPFLKNFIGKDILEIGAGMGAITRILAENASHVTALEPSEIRIACCKERCRDLKNVDYVNKTLGNFDSTKKFDFVVMIGVLEYAGKMNEFQDTNYPHDSLISKAKQFLKPNGILVIAIENKLSQKYFLPNREDHTAIYSESLHDFPNNSGYRTFSKIELRNILLEKGLIYQDWYYPYPDYKTPIAILSDKEHGNTDISGLLYHQDSQEYFYNKKLRIVDEELILKETIKANIHKDLANSFLVFAGKNNFQQFSTDWIIKRYNLSKKSTLHTELTLKSDYRLVKIDLQSRKVLSESQFFEGATLSHILKKYSYKKDFYNDWISTLKDFWEVINQHHFSGLPLTLEMHINNVMLSEGKLVFFDKEKDFEFDTIIKPEDLILRSTFDLISKNPNTYKIFGGIKVSDAVIQTLKGSLGINVNYETLMNYIDIESRYTEHITGFTREQVKNYLLTVADKKIKNEEHLHFLLDEMTVEEIINLVINYRSLDLNRNLSMDEHFFRIRELLNNQKRNRINTLVGKVSKSFMKKIKH